MRDAPSVSVLAMPSRAPCSQPLPPGLGVADSRRGSDMCAWRACRPPSGAGKGANIVHRSTWAMRWREKPEIGISSASVPLFWRRLKGDTKCGHGKHKHGGTPQRRSEGER
eukprot:scaffold18223_cov79-Isochrysis_galbana.AAC.1